MIVMTISMQCGGGGGRTTGSTVGPGGLAAAVCRAGGPGSLFLKSNNPNLSGGEQLNYVMLCYVMPCSVVLCSVMRCSVVLSCSVLSRHVVSCSVLACLSGQARIFTTPGTKMRFSKSSGPFRVRHPRKSGLRYATSCGCLGTLASDILTTPGTRMCFSKSSGPFRVRHPRHCGIPDALT